MTFGLITREDYICANFHENVNSAIFLNLINIQQKMMFFFYIHENLINTSYSE